MNLPPGQRIRRDLAGALRAAGEPEDPRIVEGLVAHLTLMAEFNARFKLTTLRDWPLILDRHVRESLLPLRWIGDGGRLLDVGSGNGYPAIPIAACRPGVACVLAERSDRKSLFLEEAVRAAGLANAHVLTADVGRAVQGAVGDPFDYVISRATLAPERFLTIALRVAAPGGRIFLYSGEAEAAAARERIETARARSLKPVAQAPIEGRRDSYLFVLEN